MRADGPVFNKVVQYPTGRRGTPVVLLAALLGVLPLANQNYDWPVPLGPRQPNSLYSFTDRFKLPLTTVRPVGANKDWPVPAGPRRAVSLYTWTDGELLPIRQGEFAPFVQDDWPVPKGPAPTHLRTWTDSFKLPLTTVRAPYQTTDWPVPKGPQRAIDLLTWLQTGYLAETSSTPFVQTNWPNPVLRGGYPTFLQKFEDHYSIQDIPALQRWDSPNPPLGARGIYAGISSIGGDISAITPVPANQFDWPVPKGPQPTHLRTWTDSFKLTLTTVRPTAANKDWPNPRGPIPVPVGFKDSFKLTLTTVRPAGRLLDWPNPFKVVRTDNLRWTQGPFLGTTATVTQPFVQTNWPNPRGLGSRDLLGYRDSFKLPLTTVRPTGRQLDWPLQLKVVRTDNLRWTQGPFLGTTVTAVRPFFQTEWPNPRNVKRRKTPPAMVPDTEIAGESPGACIVGGYFSKGQWRTVIGTPCPPKKRRSYKEPGFSRQQYEDLLEAIKTGEYQPSQRKVKRWFEGGAFTRAQYDDIKATIRLEQETRALQEKLAAEALAFAETRAHEDRLAVIEAAAQAAQAQNDIQAQAAQLEASSKLQALQNHLRMAEAVATAARRAKAEEEDDEKAIAMLFGDD